MKRSLEIAWAQDAGENTEIRDGENSRRLDKITESKSL
jgi:hypothetical protein